MSSVVLTSGSSVMRNSFKISLTQRETSDCGGADEVPALPSVGRMEYYISNSNVLMSGNGHLDFPGGKAG